MKSIAQLTKRLTFVFIFSSCFLMGYSQKGKEKEKTKKASETPGQNDPNERYKRLFTKYELHGNFCDGLARVRLNKKWGYIDTTGAIIIPIKYTEAESFSEGYGRVRMGHKWGLYDKTGREIIKPTFSMIGPFEKGKAKVMLDGKEYYMNKEGVRVDGP
jgi:hypothetical protein